MKSDSLSPNSARAGTLGADGWLRASTCLRCTRGRRPLTERANSRECGLPLLPRQIEVPSQLVIHPETPGKSRRTSKAMTTQDQAQITTLLDRYETALNASDVDAVLELYAAGGATRRHCVHDRHSWRCLGTIGIQPNGCCADRRKVDLVRR